MAKDTFYFTHDFNARMDDKIKALIRKHGMLGYGIYWAIVEDLYNNANSLRLDFAGIAHDYRIKEPIIKSIVCDFELFVVDEEFFGSLSVQKRLEERNSKSVTASKSALKRWNKDANALPLQSERNAIKERKGNKGKEINVEFDIFWDSYDKKSGSKEKLKLKWEALTDEERVLIMQYIPEYKRAQPEKQFRKNPETFLNNKAWNDELIFKNGTKEISIYGQPNSKNKTAGTYNADGLSALNSAVKAS